MKALICLLIAIAALTAGVPARNVSFAPDRAILKPTLARKLRVPWPARVDKIHTRPIQPAIASCQFISIAPNAPAPMQTPTPQRKAVLAAGAERAGAKPIEERRCSLTVVDMEVSKILRELSEQTKVNLLLLSSTNVKLTVRLDSVRLIEMLRHICALAGFQYLKVDNTYVIATEEQLKKGYADEWKEAHPEPAPIETPPPITRSYRLSYVSNSSVAQVLEKFFGTTALSVMAAPSPSSPELSKRDTAAVTGVAQGTVGESSVTAIGKILILRGQPEVVEAAMELLKQIDLPRPQVVIGVTIYDISNDALKEIGLTWTFNDVVISETNPGNLGFGSFSRTPMQFTAAIKALEKTNRAKILASPTVSVLDGEQAYILIGQRINYPVLVGFTQSNTPIFSREQERVGIFMQVSADVSEDGMITLTLYPQVSTITGFLEVNGASYPQVATREAQTTVRFRDGETIVIGGLLKDEEVVDIQRVPLLGQIPILGELFTRRKTTKTSSQVIIAIKPVLLKPESKGN